MGKGKGKEPMKADLKEGGEQRELKSEEPGVTHLQSAVTLGATPTAETKDPASKALKEGDKLVCPDCGANLHPDLDSHCVQCGWDEGHVLRRGSAVAGRFLGPQ